MCGNREKLTTRTRKDLPVTDTYLSVEDLAARWKRPASVIYGLRYRRESPPAIRIGRELRFRLEDVEAWEAERREGGG
jgi:predicted DNA-binding transcriptional regulator AlpA